jgi:hypothetical protein
MDNDQINQLKIKIEEAKRKLPTETLNAIATVDWRAEISGLRLKKGFTFEQLGSLELEIELILCGLLNPKDFPGEIEKKMGLGKIEANEVVNEMNDLVFKKIREELIKNVESKKFLDDKDSQGTILSEPLIRQEESLVNKKETKVLEGAGISIIIQKNGEVKPPGSLEKREDVLKGVENPNPIKADRLLSPAGATAKEELPPTLMQKLSGSFQGKVVETEHTLGNLSKADTANTPPPSKIDPYREIPT